MNIQSIILLCVVIIAFGIAMKKVVTNKGCGCGGTKGDCKSGCSGNCSSCSSCPYGKR